MLTVAEREDVEQRTAWKRRIVSAILNREHDDETLAAMLIAALNQGHSEGLQDAAHICEQIGVQYPGASIVGRTATVLARSIRELDKLNLKTE